MSKSFSAADSDYALEVKLLHFLLRWSVRFACALALHFNLIFQGYKR